jgi:hypothetical protein
MDIGPIQGALTLADYLAAQRLHLKPRPIFAVVGGILLLAALAAMSLAPSWELGLALAVLAGMFFAYMPLKARRTFKQFKALSEPMVIELREGGLFFKSANAEGLVPWSHLIKWRRSRTLVLLYPASGFFYMLPSRFFPSQSAFAHFMNAVEINLGKAT